MKDHEIAAAVNLLRDIATEFRETQQLRERLAQEVRRLLRPSEHDAELVARAEHAYQKLVLVPVNRLTQWDVNEAATCLKLLASRLGE